VIPRKIVAALLAISLLVTVPATTLATKTRGGPQPTSLPQPTCSLPSSNADGLEILSTYYPGYWWDHTHLTVAVQAKKGVREAQLAGVHAALATWDAVLRACFDGLITLTDVTGSQPSEQKSADIVVHYVPTAGGVSFGGYAVCGDHGCPNILVTSDFPKGKGGGVYTPEYMEWLTLHEVGHALGLGHATNLDESTDLMGYGWPDFGDPVLSQCDVRGIAFVFAWALEGSQPHRPAAGPLACQ
jgi:hypothetical protein